MTARVAPHSSMTDLGTGACGGWSRSACCFWARCWARLLFDLLVFGDCFISGDWVWVWRSLVRGTYSQCLDVNSSRTSICC